MITHTIKCEYTVSCHSDCHIALLLHNVTV